jgi:hypothetical protein
MQAVANTAKEPNALLARVLIPLFPSFKSLVEKDNCRR